MSAVTTCAVLARLAGDVEVTSSYPDLDAAIRDDAIQRGWLPPFTPSSAIDIRMFANLDVNWFAVWFRIPPGESSSFLQVLHDNGFTPYTESAPRELSVFSTWRAAEGVQPPPETSPVFEGAHHANGERVFVVVDSESGLVYYWHR